MAIAVAMRIQPPPPDFERIYIQGGWRLVERVFGTRPNVVNRWKHFVGRDRIDAERNEFMANSGKKRRV